MKNTIKIFALTLLLTLSVAGQASQGEVVTAGAEIKTTTTRS